MTENQAISFEDIFVGGGEMGALMQALDWSATPIGPIETWSQPFRTAVSICLKSRFPMVIWWGSDLVLLYNDAWQPVLGTTKHPQALGRPGKEIWSEIWHIIGIQLESVLATGQATWSDDLLLLVERHGYTEEAYFTYSYSPILLETGRVGGVFTAVSETTQRVIAERRLQTLRDLATQAALAKTVEDACKLAAQTLASNPADIPFALLYLLTPDATQLIRAESIALEAGTKASPECIDLTSTASEPTDWPFVEVMQTGQAVLVEDLQQRFGLLPKEPWDLHPRQALVLPLYAAGHNWRAGLIIVGVNPCRVLDDDYRNFFEMAAGHIATAIANARAYAEERKRAEALAQLDRAKTTFFSNVSHEFRTPLTLMLGPLSEMLADTSDSLLSSQRQQLEMVHRNGLRLLKLVNTLLDFSCIEAGRIQAVYEPTDLATFTAELASVFRSNVEQAGLCFVVECPPLPKPIYVDCEMWEKIVFNLLSNAFKFTFEGEITVHLRDCNDHIELEVRDTGIGIPAEELPHLFERFYRLKGVQGRTYEGSGIGLSLVQELVHLHGGTVQVASVLGEGTCFTVSIPTGSTHLPQDRISGTRTVDSTRLGATPYVEEALRWLPGELKVEGLQELNVEGSQELNVEGLNKLSNLQPINLQPTNLQPDNLQPANLQPTNLQPTNLQPPTPTRILLVDDNADMRDYVKHLLSQRYEVETVSNGVTALAAIHQHLPNLVLTDVMMPRLDGFELLRELRADPHTRQIPIILLSARAGEEACIEGLEAGADDYLIKPFSARELLARIEANLKMAQLRQEAALRQQELRVQAQSAREHIGLVLESITDAFVAFDRQWRYTYVNQEAAHLLQKTREELLGQSIWELFPDAVDTPFEQELKRSLTEQIALEFEEFYPAFHIWVEVRTYPSSEGLSIYFRDITDQKRVQQRQQIQYAITRVLAEATTLAEAVPELLRSLCESLGWQFSTIWSLDSHHHVLRFVNSWHTPHLNMQEFLEVSQDTTFPLGVGLPGRILTSSQPIWIEELSEDDNFPRAVFACRTGLHTAFGFPIRLGNDILGVIECFSNCAQKPDEDLLEMMAAIGTQIGQFMERKRTEEALRESQKLFESFMNHTPVTAFIKDEAGRYIYVNALVERLFNRTLVDWVGKTDFDVFPAEIAQQVRNHDVAVLTTDQAVQRMETVPVDDEERYYMSFKFPIQDASGRRLLAGMSLDITQQIRAQEALRDSEERLRVALWASEMGTYRWDINTNTLDWDENLNRLFGLLEGATVRRIEEFLEFIHPDDREGVLVQVKRCIHLVADFDREFRIIWPDGSIHWILDKGRTIFDDQGNPLYMTGACVDITQAKQTEMALRDSEERYRSLVMVSSQLVWRANAQGQFVELQGWEEFTGQPVQELLIQGCKDAIHPDDIEWVTQAWWNAVATKSIYEVEHRIRKYDGTYEYFAVRGVPMLDDQGQVSAWVGMSTNINSRKQAEEALRLSRERLDLVIEATQLGLWYCDLPFDNLNWNDKCKEHFGLQPDAEVTIDTFYESLHPDDRERTHLAIARAIAQRSVYDIDYRTVAPDGRVRWIRATGRSFYDGEGNPIRFDGITINITERKRTEEALRESESRFRMMADGAPVFIWMSGLDGHCTYFNQPWLDFVGQTLEEALTIGWPEGIHPDDKEYCLNTYMTAFNARSRFSIEYRHRRKDGEYRWLLDEGVPLFNSEGTFLGYIGSGIDITERKQLDLALRQSESRFRSIFESNMIAMGFCHISGDVPVVNDALLELLGYTREEFVAKGLSWSDFCPSDYAHLDERARQEALEFGVCTPYEKEFMRQDGSRVPVLGGGGTFDAESGVFFAIDLAERKRAEQAQQYLTEASQALYSSLDYQTTLASIARLTVPRLADWCTVHLVEEDGSVQSLATAHVDPDKIAWAHKINEKYPFDPNAPSGAAQVLRTGQSQLYPDIPDRLVVEAARDEEHLQFLREVGFKSVMIVPLLARGRTLGTISFVAAESGRRYDQADLALAEELARRAGLAVDNARLYRQAQQARQVAEQAAERTARLQKVTAALGEALTPQQVTEVVITQGIEALGSRAGVVAVLVENSTFLEIVGAFGYPQEFVDSWKRFPLSAPLPLAEAVRTRRPIFLESATDVVSNYSQIADIVPVTGSHALVAIPLVVEGQTLGGLGISFSETQVFSQEDQGFVLTLAQQCAQAIARARLYEAEQQARAVSEAARREAEAANRIKDEFLAVLSHELRSPLNPILGWVKLLRSRQFDEKAKDRALETIERNAKLQTQLIDDLLDVSRILRGKMVLNVAPVNLVTTIEAALETVSLAAQAKQIQIETVLDANVGSIYGDFNRLQQVIWNLLSNAVKFTPSGGRIEVRLEKVEQGLKGELNVVGLDENLQPFADIPPQRLYLPSTQYAQIQVKDTGKGIARGFLPHVFEYFRQENSSTTRQFGGLGLGLAIVRYLVELHGGSVTAESPGEGLGATFTVHLPLMEATTPEISHDEVPSSISADLSGLRVLVVDDESDIRELLAFILEQSGAKVTRAASAQEALTLFNESVPDVLLSDIGMPEVDGYMLMRQIRAFSPQKGGQVRAIALTAYAGEYHQQQAIQAGFQQHVSKPVEPKELVRAIAHLVGRI